MYTHTHEIAGVGIQTDCTAIESISVSSADVWNLPNEEVKPFFRNIKWWVDKHRVHRKGGQEIIQSCVVGIFLAW